jgi:hypothetical protein
MKRQRMYWIQLCYGNDRDDEWLESFDNYNDTCNLAALLMVKRDAAFALVLKSWVRRGRVAPDRAILADFQRDEVVGAKRLEVRL